MMAVEVRLPKLTDEMEEGTVSRWLKQVGDTVAAGEPLVEVETEKVIVEVESTIDGILLEIVAAEQEVVPVEGVLCRIGEPGEKTVPQQPPEVSAAVSGAAAGAAARAQASGAAPTGASASGAALTGASPSGEPAPASNVVPIKPARPPARPAREAALPAGMQITPLARRVAGELGIDLSAISGTGIGGKIIMSDLQPFLGVEAPGVSGAPTAARQPIASARQPLAGAREDIAPAPGSATDIQAAPSPAGSGQTAQSGFEDIPLTPMRGAVARRMGRSKREIPHFYMTAEIDLSECLALRKRLNRKLEQGKITVNDLMIKAVALALTEAPELNAEFREGVLRRYTEVHVGLAVAMEGGLVTPVVRDCGQKTITAIARETARLVAKARERKLRPEEMRGGTFTISNLGMYEVVEFSAIIDPPQVGILAIAKPVERPVVKNGWVVVSTRLLATLSADHRAVDGVTGAAFLGAFKRALEDPERLLL